MNEGEEDPVSQNFYKKVRSDPSHCRLCKSVDDIVGVFFNRGVEFL